jgi:hypothetical protein
VSGELRRAASFVLTSLTDNETAIAVEQRLVGVDSGFGFRSV